MDGKRGPAEERTDAEAVGGGSGEPAPHPAPRAPAGQHPPSPSPPERFGPLELRRMRKEDGRRLIVYARTERPR